jgi:hypothetical protein
MTALMDKSSWAFGYELMRLVVGVSLLLWQGGWFGLSQWVPGADAIMAAYLGVSLAVAAWFTVTEVRQFQSHRAPVGAEPAT